MMDLMKSIRQNSLSLGYIIDFIVFDRLEELFDFSTDWIFQKNEICIQKFKIFEIFFSLERGRVFGKIQHPRLLLLSLSALRVIFKIFFRWSVGEYSAKFSIRGNYS